MKSVRIRSYSGPHFSAFGLNTERYCVSLHIQSKCGKMPTRKTPNTDLFYAVKANTITYRKSFLFPKEMEFNLFSAFPCLAVFIFLPKYKIYPDESFTKNLASEKQIFDALAVDVKARSLVNFNVRSFKVHFL